MAGALAALMAIKPSDSHMQSGPRLAHALPLEHRTSEPLYSLASYLHIKSIARSGKIGAQSVHGHFAGPSIATLGGD